MAEVGIAQDDAYITNAVKHFYWEPRGKRRLHKKPAWRHIEACKPWLHAEILVVRPRTIVCLGAVASQSLLGRDFRLTKHRGTIIKCPWAPGLLATYHPSAILRAPDDADRRQKRREFVGDLRRVAEHLSSAAG
jgi:DNA polymerase